MRSYQCSTDTETGAEMRVKQHQGTKGSLKWMQLLVERSPNTLDQRLWAARLLSETKGLTWLSPIRDDHWSEYSDSKFLEKIGHLELAPELSAFWPSRGPQWDGLAEDGSGGVFLFEAKAHPAEMSSSCKAGAASKDIITSSMQAAKKSFVVSPEADWLESYYQYANRLAHLYFLQEHGVDVRMVFLYFLGDEEMHGPRSESEWRSHITSAHAHLGLCELPLGAASVFFCRWPS